MPATFILRPLITVAALVRSILSIEPAPRATKYVTRGVDISCQKQSKNAGQADAAAGVDTTELWAALQMVLMLEGVKCRPRYAASVATLQASPCCSASV
jgi:hypothetical protein